MGAQQIAGHIAGALRQTPRLGQGDVGLGRLVYRRQQVLVCLLQAGNRRRLSRRRRDLCRRIGQTRVPTRSVTRGLSVVQRGAVGGLGRGTLLSCVCWAAASVKTLGILGIGRLLGENVRRHDVGVLLSGQRIHVGLHEQCLGRRGVVGVSRFGAGDLLDHGILNKRHAPQVVWHITTRAAQPADGRHRRRGHGLQIRYLGRRRLPRLR